MRITGDYIVHLWIERLHELTRRRHHHYQT